MPTPTRSCRPPPPHSRARDTAGRAKTVVRMLHEVGSVDKVPELIKAVKAGDRRLMGFGHRVYKNYDPRARIIKQIAYDVFEVTGKNPAIDVALELERIALEDEYFIERRLYPNVDFYSGTIYEAMGFQMEMFPVLFAIGRHRRLGRSVGGDARERRANRPAAPDVPRRGRAGLRPPRSPRRRRRGRTRDPRPLLTREGPRREGGGVGHPPTDALTHQRRAVEVVLPRKRELIPVHRAVVRESGVQNSFADQS